MNTRRDAPKSLCLNIGSLHCPDVTLEEESSVVFTCSLLLADRALVAMETAQS